MVFRAASSRTASSGTDRHAWATRAMPTAWAVFCSQLNGSSMSPKPMSTPFTIPWWVSKMERQKMPATIDATAHGSSRAMKKIDTPRKPRLRTRAVTSARGSVMAVDIAAKNKVRGIAARTSSSAGNRTR